jgi:hypothetical protein
LNPVFCKPYLCKRLFSKYLSAWILGDERLLHYLGVIMVEVYDEVKKNDERKKT